MSLTTDYIGTMTARSVAFGTVAIPMNAAEFATGVKLGAVQYLSPLLQGYRPYIAGFPVHVIGGDHATT